MRTKPPSWRTGRRHGCYTIIVEEVLHAVRRCPFHRGRCCCWPRRWHRLSPRWIVAKASRCKTRSTSFGRSLRRSRTRRPRWRINLPQPPTAPPQQLQGGGNDLLAQLLTRVDALEEQVRQLRGRIDETQNQLSGKATTLGSGSMIWRSRSIHRGATGRRPAGPLPALGWRRASAPGARVPPPPLPAPPRPSGPRPPELALAGGERCPGPSRLSRGGGSGAGGSGKPHLAARL